LVAASRLQLRQFALRQMLRSVMVVVQDNAANSAVRVVSVQSALKVKAKASAVMVVVVTHVVAVAVNVRVNVVPIARLSAAMKFAAKPVLKVEMNLDQKAEPKAVAHVLMVATRETKCVLMLKACKMLQTI
jgi:hypothetical protein